MSKSQRTKGAVGEREAAELLRAVFPNARRRSTGEESQVRQGADLAGVGPLCVQVKLSGCPQPLKALAEAIKCAEPHEIPVALVRQSRRGLGGQWVAVLPAAELVALLHTAGFGNQPEQESGDAEPAAPAPGATDLP